MPKLPGAWLGCKSVPRFLSPWTVDRFTKHFWLVPKREESENRHINCIRYGFKGKSTPKIAQNKIYNVFWKPSVGKVPEILGDPLLFVGPRGQV